MFENPRMRLIKTTLQKKWYKFLHSDEKDPISDLANILCLLLLQRLAIELVGRFREK